jgi:hypothetical protein
MKSVLVQPNFKKLKLPIALGKTISNETFVVDLAAKCPSRQVRKICGLMRSYFVQETSAS